LAYFLFYIKRDPAVSPEIGLQVQDNDGVSHSLADAHDNEQHHSDLITNKQQDMSVCEDINQVNGTNVCNQSAPKEINRITNIDKSSANYNANVNPRVQQTNRTVINVDDDKSNADDDTCALCLQAIRSDADRGYADTDGQCRCLRDYHYDCLRAMRNTNERNRKNMKCSQCRRHFFCILDSERQNRYLSDEDEDVCPICQDRPGREFELGRMRCTCTARFHHRCLHQHRNQRSSYVPDWKNGMKCVTCKGIAAGTYWI
jgi:hypothetical protein